MSGGGQQFGNSPYASGQFGAPGQYGAPMPPAKSGNNAVFIIIVVAVVLVVTLLVCGVLVGLLLPAVQAARDAARRMQDSNNVKQIALAMHNLHDVQQSFPAPAILDADGNEALSWRVQVLPYVEQVGLYNQIDTQNPKAWNDPSMAFLLQTAPSVFVSPRGETPGGHANVFVIATQPGPPGSVQAAFTHGESVPIREFVDGTSNTIMAISLANTSVEWTKPSALTPEEAYAALLNERMGANVAFADGSVRFVSTDIDKSTFIALCTRNGNEDVSGGF